MKRNERGARHFVFVVTLPACDRPEAEIVLSNMLDAICVHCTQAGILATVEASGTREGQGEKP